MDLDLEEAGLLGFQIDQVQMKTAKLGFQIGQVHLEALGLSGFQIGRVHLEALGLSGFQISRVHPEAAILQDFQIGQLQRKVADQAFLLIIDLIQVMVTILVDLVDPYLVIVTTQVKLADLAHSVAFMEFEVGVHNK